MFSTRRTRAPPPPRRLVFTVRFTRREQRVDLVDEDHGRLARGSDSKEGPHHLLALADPLGGETRGGYAEEGGAALRRHRATDA